MRLVTEPYVSASNVTPDDDDLIAPTRGIMAAATGDISVQFPDGSTATFVDVIPGNVYPIQVVKVMSTGTDATGIVALY